MVGTSATDLKVHNEYLQILMLASY